jgi:hypothetical protein
MENTHKFMSDSKYVKFHSAYSPMDLLTFCAFRDEFLLKNLLNSTFYHKCKMLIMLIYGSLFLFGGELRQNLNL